MWLVVADMDVLLHKNEAAFAAHEAGDGSDPGTIRSMRRAAAQLRANISEHVCRRAEIVQAQDTEAMKAFISHTASCRLYQGPQFGYLCGVPPSWRPS